MGRVSATLSVSLPPEMVEELEQARKDERRTRSEFVREALRQYMERGAELRRLRQRIAELKEEEPTPEEVEAIQAGQQEFRQGDFVTLNKLRHDMGRHPQQPRRKESQARSRR
jgi:Arc/MetJ-type ribon-helix-helix transcriptional regulator